MTSTPPDASSPRKLIVCCDGTDNTLTAGVEDTNVLRLYTHVHQHLGPDMLLYYDPGVGTPDSVPPTDPLDWFRRTSKRMAGLATGRGVYKNIAEAYLFLMRNWRGPQDRIYCFGFSRGAFTVRCVSGMVNLFGILAPEHEAMIPTLIHIYFSQPEQDGGSFIARWTRGLHRMLARPGKAGPEAAGHSEDALPITREMLATQVRDNFTSAAGHDAWIHWVGVWDTVESVGLPGPLSRGNPSTATLRGKRIRHVRHALALDEHRWAFDPRLYTEPGDIDDTETPQTLKQRWFPGAHSDVGGGYLAAEAGLSDHALRWMVDELADDLGIPRMEGKRAERLRHDPLWDTPWWALAGMTLRDMNPRTTTGQPIACIEDPASDLPAGTVWSRRRPWWPLLLAVVTGLLALAFSGACLLEAGTAALLSARGWREAAVAALQLALLQLHSVHGAGLLAGGLWREVMQRSLGWSMAWDLVFTASWGYLVARVSSRVFASLAGKRSTRSGQPAWRVLGFAPLVAVGGDVCEDAFTLAALALQAIGAADWLTVVSLWLAGLAGVCKLAGLAACVPLLVMRVFVGVPRVPPPVAAA